MQDCHKQAQNPGTCPVCKEHIQENELITCEPVCDHDLTIEQQISLSLKYRKGCTIYKYDTMTEDLNFSQIIRMRTQKIMGIIEQEINAILNQINKTAVTDRSFPFLKSALQISQRKLEHSHQIAKQKHEFKLDKNRKIIDNIIYDVLEKDSMENSSHFYQQSSGRLIFLHSLCQKYIERSNCSQKLMGTFSADLLYLEEDQFDPDLVKEYPALNHLLLGQEIQFVIISLSKIIDKKSNEEFMKEFKGLLKQKQLCKVREENEAKIRNQIYEEQSRQRRRLQKMMYSQFHDINVPIVMHEIDFDQSSFPSLGTQSSDQPSITSAQPQNEEQDKPTQAKQQINPKQDFPDFFESKVSAEKSERIYNTGGRRKRRKKQKTIDITHQLFAPREQEDY